VLKVDRRIRWHYTTTILRLCIGARLTRYRNCKFHNGCRTISRHADGISRYSVSPSAGPLLSLGERVKGRGGTRPDQVWRDIDAPTVSGGARADVCDGSFRGAGVRRGYVQVGKCPDTGGDEGHVVRAARQDGGPRTTRLPATCQSTGTQSVGRRTTPQLHQIRAINPTGARL